MSIFGYIITGFGIYYLIIGLKLIFGKDKEKSVNQRIIICGKGASGKDYLKEKFIDKNFQKDISYTSRPPRTGEINGDDYHFITNDEFEDMIKLGKFYQYAKFNGWYYGTTKESWNNSKIFIMTPSGIKKILHEERKNCFIIYIDTDEQTRIERLGKRSDADTINRRLVADENDFYGFQNYDLLITKFS